MLFEYVAKFNSFYNIDFSNYLSKANISEVTLESTQNCLETDGSLRLIWFLREDLMPNVPREQKETENRIK